MENLHQLNLCLDEDKDFLVGYPRVHLDYKFSEVAFLLYTLFKRADTWKQHKIISNNLINNERMSKLSKIEENFTAKIAAFNLEELKMERMRRRKVILKSFADRVKAALFYQGKDYEFLKQMRTELVRTFDVFCQYELQLIRILVAEFVQDINDF